ncbi:hypothetical protein D9M73_240810 [compost metagenome]
MHAEQLLPAVGTEGVDRFHHFAVDLANAQVGQADQRRRGVDHGGENRRDLAQAKQHQHRDQVHEARHGLHDVQQRHQHRTQAIAARRENAQRYADQHRNDRRHHHQRQGLHQLVPEADRTHQEQQADDH